MGGIGMYATTGMPCRRPLAARPRGWLLALLAIASLGAAIAPAGLGVQFAAPIPTGSTPIVRKVAGPLSARLAALAQAGEMPANRAAAMRALSLPEHGPGSLLVGAAGDPLVYIRLAQVDARSLKALHAAGGRIIHASERYGVVTVLVAPGQLAAIAAVPG